MESLTVRAWPAVEEELYDGWLLRAANGYTGRANSVCAVEAGTQSPATKISVAEQWYTARGLAPKFRLHAFSQPAGLDGLLESLGYLRDDDVRVMECVLDGVPEMKRTVEGRAAELTMDAWFAGRRPETVEKQGAILLRIQPLHWLLGWVVDGSLVARVLAVVEKRWVGIFNLSVDETCRRHGFGRALMVEALKRARECGAEHAYLQMVAENHAAARLYASLGFSASYDYWYRTKPEPLS
jgi:ribosomal protein S18 acetylase RimI-like enzyme